MAHARFRRVGLGNYGGPTETMALADSSPARDGGIATGLTPAVDQRGSTRVLGSALDLGSYESGELAAGYNAWIAEQLPADSNLSVTADDDGDGILNLGEYGFLGDPKVTTSDPSFGEIVTVAVTSEDHLLLRFPHRLDAADAIFEVRAASDIVQLDDGGNFILVYRHENGTMTEGSGFVSINNGVSPPVVEVMDTQSTNLNERRFI
ncbi:MAG: hypothetical protein ACI9DF_000333 [Verrucomicrobiales bacterium]|jgi:hypothetical protein